MREGIQLSLSENVRLDVELAVGQTVETVTVSGNVSAVQTESSSLGSVVRKEIIDSLPLKGHSSLFMFTLATGVVNNRSGEDTRANDTITNVSYSANGAPMASGDVSVDGVANTVNVNRGVNISQWVPAVDAVGEFKLQTGTLPAEYGRSGGSFMNIVIKSGTNDLHGTAYEFLRNAALDANSFFNNRTGLAAGALQLEYLRLHLGRAGLASQALQRPQPHFLLSQLRRLTRRQRSYQLAERADREDAYRRFFRVSAVIYNPFSGRMVNGVPTRDPAAGQHHSAIAAGSGGPQHHDLLSGGQYRRPAAAHAMGAELQLLIQVAARL